MTLSEELTWRGFVNQTTLKSVKELDEKKLKFYFGVDPSADSMTVGNLAAAMMVRHFIDYGHQATLLVGGATGIIGDPDGKRQERDLKDLDEIMANKKAIAAQYKTIFADKEFDLVDNYDWFKGLGYIDFLRTVGKHVSMTQMLDREFIKSRIGEGGSGISYAEFSYSLIQGYDFLHLFREHGVSLQLCGADQWGNSIAGVELIRKIEGGEAHVFSTPLIVNKTTGVKFGKSEAGAVWLDANKTSVYKFYQFWLNADDAGVIDYLKIFTLLEREDILSLAESLKSHPQERRAQKALAFEVTKLVHGEERAQAAKSATEVLFGSQDAGALRSDELTMLSGELPGAAIGTTLIEVLVSSGAAASNGEARRLLESGAVSVNGAKTQEDLVLDTVSLIRKGKNTFILVK
jgi:tyrosyl-tRNA synthetase